MRYWLTRRSFYQDFETEIRSANALWDDDLSRDVYTRPCIFGLLEIILFARPDMAHQYFPPDLPQWKQPIRMIDCGAYDGDAIRTFFAMGIIFRRWLLSNQTCKLCSPGGFLQKSGKTIPETVFGRVACMPLHASLGSCLAWVRQRYCGFRRNLHQLWLWMKLLPNFAPTLIKMDIEGAEPEALLAHVTTMLLTHPGWHIRLSYPSHLWKYLRLANCFRKHVRIPVIFYFPPLLIVLIPSCNAIPPS